MASGDELFEQAMKLPERERQELANRLYGSCEPGDATDEWDPEYLAELEERVARQDRGETKAVDVYEALEASRKKLRESRGK
jgi:hypothetical protein